MKRSTMRIFQKFISHSVRCSFYSFNSSSKYDSRQCALWFMLFTLFLKRMLHVAMSHKISYLGGYLLYIYKLSFTNLSTFQTSIYNVHMALQATDKFSFLMSGNVETLCISFNNISGSLFRHDSIQSSKSFFIGTIRM